MEITSAEFIKGIIGSDDILTDGKKQIAFIGRSNVGKSSVINSLLNRKDFVRSGSMPGKTKQIDFFLINKDFYFVDLQGYGYAKLSETQRLKLKKLMLWYLFENTNIDRKIVLIVDAEVGPKKSDLEFLEMLDQYKLDVVLVANKIDKVKKSEVNKKLNKIKTLIPNHEIFAFSAKTKKGRDILMNTLF